MKEEEEYEPLEQVRHLISLASTHTLRNRHRHICIIERRAFVSFFYNSNKSCNPGRIFLKWPMLDLLTKRTNRGIGLMPVRQLYQKVK